MDNKAFFKLSYGMYVISSELNGRLNGQIANTVFQITSEPKMVAVSINKQNLTHQFMQKNGRFSISVLSKDTPMEFIGTFGFNSGKDMDKFKDIEYIKGNTGVPVVTQNALSYFELKVEQQIDVYTHTIFIGEVVNADLLRDGEPMTYDYYHKVKRGTAPKTAPTYVDPSTLESAFSRGADQSKAGKYRCTLCGYIYDPEKGDPEAGVLPNTAFEKLPDDWVCPICGVSKDKFEKID